VAAPTASRTAALQTLRAVRGGVLAGRAFDAAAAGLDGRDRAWAQELAYGTLRLRARLDFRLAALSRRALQTLDPDVLDILRLGAYQLTEMGGVPAYAAVSQSAELASREAGRGATGFVNGVLQSLRRQGDGPTFPAFEADPVAHLATWGSHPRWLVERWVARFGADATRRLVEANNRTPELYLRLLGDPAATAAALAGAGLVVADVAYAPRSVRLLDGALMDALRGAPVIVQDPAAGLVATFIDAPAGARVYDVAAAPGGKALALACDRPDAGPALVVAADASPDRLGRLTESVARLSRQAPAGLGRAVPVAPVVADGRLPPLRHADVVLLDAPCTGTGTLRRHPDGRWRIRPADIASLTALQRDLLAAAARVVAPGGLLVYSTCSLEPEENESQVHTFLEAHTEFEMEDGPALAGGVVDEAGALYVLPHEHGWDGAYAVRLRRRAPRPPAMAPVKPHAG
jgi:16S rRNA (cytosine967-C5)-methyltransferase